VKRPIKIVVFEDVTHSDLVGRYWRFGRTCCLYSMCRLVIWSYAETAYNTVIEQLVEYKGSKVVPPRAIQACRSCRGVCLLIANHGTRWRWAFDFRPRPSYPPGKNPGTHWTEGWTSRSRGSCVGPAWIRTPDRLARSVVTVLTTQSWVLNFMRIDTKAWCYGVIILKLALK
jgi:hypothetical protein